MPSLLDEPGDPFMDVILERLEARIDALEAGNARMLGTLDELETSLDELDVAAGAPPRLRLVTGGDDA